MRVNVLLVVFRDGMDIRLIAKRARVSTATVSRTINGIRSVDPRLAKRVWKVVKELRYVPNRHARALVSGRSRIFGLIVSEITNPFFPEIVQVFENIAAENGYDILLTSTGHDPMRMELSVRKLIERRVDGVAVLTFGMEEQLLEHLTFREVPLVFVDVGPPKPRMSNIRIDYLHGIRQAVQHLAALRHERIAFISGSSELKSAVARRNAFLSAINEIDLETHLGLIREGDHTIEGGMRELDPLLENRPAATAILCHNDLTAIGVMRRAWELGVEIPKQLSVVGFDDIHLSRFVVPPLTTVQMSQAELARIAFHALLADVRRETPAPRGTEYVLETKLVLRDSTALAPSGSPPRGCKKN